MYMDIGTDTVPGWAFRHQKVLMEQKFRQQQDQMEQQHMKGEADRQNMMLRAESDKNSLLGMSAVFRSRRSNSY